MLPSIWQLLATPRWPTDREPYLVYFEPTPCRPPRRPVQRKAKPNARRALRSRKE